MENTGAFGEPLKKTPLYDKHVMLGARMVPFSGWSMPVQYESIIEEHLHTRSSVSIFDISHMGEFIIRGRSALKDVERLVTCRLDGLENGGCRYGFLLNDDGGIIDDLIVFKISDENYMLVVNAGTQDKDEKWIRGHISGGTEFINESPCTAKIDVQGPLSRNAMSLFLDVPALRSLGRFHFVGAKWSGMDILVGATGYTGGTGYEIFLPSGAAEKAWEALLNYDGVKPAGLGARDSLRLEAGYMLYGHDIDETRTPFEAGLSRFVCMEKDFLGKEALISREKRGFDRVLVGFVCEGRRSARDGYIVTRGGNAVGKVTSGAFSPCLKKGIGLSYIDKNLSREGAEVVITDGSKIEIKAAIARPPFVRRDRG